MVFKTTAIDRSAISPRWTFLIFSRSNVAFRRYGECAELRGLTLSRGQFRGHHKQRISTSPLIMKSQTVERAISHLWSFPLRALQLVDGCFRRAEPIASIVPADAGSPAQFVLRSRGSSRTRCRQLPLWLARERRPHSVPRQLRPRLTVPPSHTFFFTACQSCWPYSSRRARRRFTIVAIRPPPTNNSDAGSGTATGVSVNCRSIPTSVFS